jgi:hypothetical protein
MLPLRSFSLALCIGLLLGCSTKNADVLNNETGGNTSWLRTCTKDPECGATGVCFEGLCSFPCNGGAQCAEYAEAACYERRADRGCPATESVCMPTCNAPTDCDAWNGLTCAAGLCVPRGCVAATAGSSSEPPESSISTPGMAADATVIVSSSATSTDAPDAALPASPGSTANDASIAPGAPSVEALPTSTIAASAALTTETSANLPDAGPTGTVSYSAKLTNAINCCDMFTLVKSDSAADTCLFAELRWEVASETLTFSEVPVRATAGAVDCWTRLGEVQAQTPTGFGGSVSIMYGATGAVMTAHLTLQSTPGAEWPAGETEFIARELPTDGLWYATE